MLHRETAAPLHLMRPAHPGALDPCDPSDLSCYPLVPFSNRICRGHFTFHGRDVTLPPNQPFTPFPIHGHGWQAVWAVEERTERTALLSYRHDTDAWPYPYVALQRFDLDDHSLTVTMELTNIGDLPMPAGLGLHPFFPKPHGTSLTAGLDEVWLGDETHIPTERVPLPLAWDFPHGITLDETALDNNFTGWDGHAVIDWPSAGASLAIEASQQFRHAVIYAPHHQDYFCFEPVSHMTDAVNRAAAGEAGTGLVELGPGKSFGGSITFSVELRD